MTTRRLLLALATLSLGLGRPLFAADQPAPTKPGYTVVLEVKVDEAGVAEDATVVQSDDTTADHLLERSAMVLVREMKLAPRLKDGKAVKHTVRAPFVFPVEGDEGPEPATLSRPRIIQAIQPVYPAELADKGEIGGTIFEVVIGIEGKIQSLKVLRSTHPAFVQAAETALRQWTFVPSQQDGKAVESRWRLSLCFETDVHSNDWTWRVAPRPSLGNYTVVRRTQPPTAPAPAAETKPAEPPAGK